MAIAFLPVVQRSLDCSMTHDVRYYKTDSRWIQNTNPKAAVYLSPALRLANCLPMMQAKVGPTRAPCSCISLTPPDHRSISYIAYEHRI